MRGYFVKNLDLLLKVTGTEDFPRLPGLGEGDRDLAAHAHARAGHQGATARIEKRSAMDLIAGGSD